MVWASDSPSPSCASNTFISETTGSPAPSVAVVEMRQTPPSVRVPSTSIRKSLILRARVSTSGGARESMGLSDMKGCYRFDLSEGHYMFLVASKLQGRASNDWVRL